MSRVAVTVDKPWALKAYYSQGIVTSGRTLETAGITARDPEGRLVGTGDMRAQVAQAFRNLADVLEAAGAKLEHVVKYTVYTTDIDRYIDETFDIRAPYFIGRPAATLVQVSRLWDAAMLVEVSAVVHLPDQVSHQ